MSGGKFDRPARKLHARDVLRLTKRGISGDISGHWSYSEDGLVFDVAVIWIQGRVAAYSQSKSEVCVQDGDFKINITNCQNIPGGNSWITEGMYVMVVGELEQDSSGRGAVRAIKMADLSVNAVHQSTWNHEVAEIKMLMRENPDMCR